MKTTLILLSLALSLSSHAQNIRPMSADALQTARHLLTPAAIKKGDFVRNDEILVPHSIRRRYNQGGKKIESTLLSVFWPGPKEDELGEGGLFIEGSDGEM